MSLNHAEILGAQFKRSQETVKTTHTPFHDGHVVHANGTMIVLYAVAWQVCHGE